MLAIEGVLITFNLERALERLGCNVLWPKIFAAESFVKRVSKVDYVITSVKRSLLVRFRGKRRNKSQTSIKTTYYSGNLV